LRRRTWISVKAEIDGRANFSAERSAFQTVVRQRAAAS